MSLVTIDEQYQVTIPTSLRRQLGLQAGDRLEATIENGVLSFKPRGKADRTQFVDELSALLTVLPIADEDKDKTEEEILASVDHEIASVRAERRSRTG